MNYCICLVWLEIRSDLVRRRKRSVGAKVTWFVTNPLRRAPPFIGCAAAVGGGNDRRRQRYEPSRRPHVLPAAMSAARRAEGMKTWHEARTFLATVISLEFKTNTRCPTRRRRELWISCVNVPQSVLKLWIIIVIIQVVSFSYINFKVLIGYKMQMMHQKDYIVIFTIFYNFFYWF